MSATRLARTFLELAQSCSNRAAQLTESGRYESAELELEAGEAYVRAANCLLGED